MDDLNRLAARSGGTSPTSFPHLCPRYAGGASEENCTNLTNTFQQNKDACCASKCNSELRKCVVCLEMGRRGKAAHFVVDPRTGRCDEHRNGAVSEQALRQVRLPAAPAPPKPEPPPASLVIKEQPVEPLTSSSANVVEPSSPQRLGSTSVWSQPPSNAWQDVLVRVRKAIAAGQYVTIDPLKIRPMEGQPREYFPEDEQDSLEESLGLTGQIQDTIIRKVPRLETLDTPQISVGDRVWRIGDTEYEVVDGERRWRGALQKAIGLRAKLIEIDDDAAYFVSSVANFNRVDHTLLEAAKNVEKLHNGPLKLPIEAVAAVQGIKLAQAKKLQNILKLPADIRELMHPGMQKAKGEEVLGKSFSYEIARLASNPVLHEHARNIARRAVRREVKLPQVRLEVDRILSRSGTARDVLGERNQPSRRLTAIEGRITVAFDNIRDVKARLAEMKAEGILSESAERLGPDLNNIADAAENALKLIGVKRTKSESQ